MTRVCLVGDDDVELRYELLSRETSREALSTYDLRAPYQNTVALDTVSLGAAVSLLNDLNWYLIRFVDEALVMEPSVSETEWLSRDLAKAIRDDEIAPDDSGRFLKVYGVERGGSASTGDSPNGDDVAGPVFGADDGDDTDGTDSADGTDDADGTGDGDGSESTPDQDAAGTSRADDSGGPLPRLVEPMLVTRTGETLPDYDLRPVDETIRVRVTEDEFEA